jgi:hypothetical protein
MGLSRREFAKSEGCTEGAIRYALKKGRLVARPDGTLDASQLGGRWKRNLPAATKGRVKCKASPVLTAPPTQASAQIPFEVAEYFGWNDPDFDPEALEGFGLLLDLARDRRTDPESIGYSMMMHGASLLQREAYRFGWRKDAPKPSTADADPLGPEERLSDATGQLLTFGLVRKLGRAMQPDDPDDPDVVTIDIGDPAILAEAMVYLASEILEQELKRRRREAGVAGPRD